MEKTRRASPSITPPLPYRLESGHLFQALGVEAWLAQLKVPRFHSFVLRSVDHGQGAEEIRLS